MPCDSRPFRPRQTLQERKEQVKKATETLDALLKKKKVKPVVGPQGGITFKDWVEPEKAGMTDACAYRRIMSSGSQLAKLEILRAEQLSGRTVSKQVIASGEHSHDGGLTWGRH
jgi:hypothetical protein